MIYVPRQFTANLSEDAARRAQRLCDYLQISRAELIRRAIEAYGEAQRVSPGRSWELDSNGDVELRPCICADPEHCTMPIPGRMCRSGQTRDSQ